MDGPPCDIDRGDGAGDGFAEGDADG
jgi:hypothetical protein